eukprot:3415266-Amphidinium_carterae.1
MADHKSMTLLQAMSLGQWPKLENQKCKNQRLLSGPVGFPCRCFWQTNPGFARHTRIHHSGLAAAGAHALQTGDQPKRQT